jgi:hypothetical protein
MYICPVCGKEYDKKRSINAHMLKAHYDDYKAHNFSLSEYLHQGDPDIRPLDLSVESEAVAYREGYRFIDACGYCFTSEEVKEKGWI